MRAWYPFAVSSLAMIFVVAGVHAQAPAEGDEQEAARDPDEIAAEEFVRDLRDQAEAAPEAGEANDVGCTDSICTTIDEAIALIRWGPRSAEDDAASENSDSSAENQEDESGPDL